MTLRAEAVELAARSLCRAAGSSPDAPTCDITGAVVPQWMLWRSAAEKDLDALRALLAERGWQLVPMLATAEMERFVNSECDTPDADLGWSWQAWLAHAPDPLAAARAARDAPPPSAPGAPMEGE